MAHAGAWGLLRNMLQEFPALAWSGAEASPLQAPAQHDVEAPEDNDAFGAAAAGGHWAAPRLLPRAPLQEAAAAGCTCKPFSTLSGF